MSFSDRKSPWPTLLFTLYSDLNIARKNKLSNNTCLHVILENSVMAWSFALPCCILPCKQRAGYQRKSILLIKMGIYFFFFLEYSFTEENYVLIHLWKKFRRPAGHSWQEMPPKCSQAFNFYSMSGPIQEKTLTSWKRFYNQLAFFFVCLLSPYNKIVSSRSLH